MPIGSLEEICRQDVGLGAAGIVGEADDFSGVSQFNQTFEGGNLISHLDVEVRCHFETTLLAAFLGDDLSELSAFALL
jgi:hypothetical protein